MRSTKRGGVVVVLAALLLGGCGKKSDPTAALDEPKHDPVTGAGMSKEEAQHRYRVVFELQTFALWMYEFHDPVNRLPPADGTLMGFNVSDAPKDLTDIPFPTGYSWRVGLLATHNNPAFSTGRDVFFALWRNKYPLAADAAPGETWNRAELRSKPYGAFIYKPEYVPPGDWNTPYRVLIGGGAVFEPKRQTRLGDIKDGVEKTILIVASGESVPWPKPDELVYDPAKPLPKLFGLFPDGFYAAFADGKIRFIKKDTDEKLIRAMITREGGEPIPELPPVVDSKALGEVAGDPPKFAPAVKSP